MTSQAFPFHISFVHKMALDLAQVMAVVQSNYAKDPSFLVSSSNFSSTPAFPIARSKSDFDKRGDSRHGHGGGGGGNEAELFAAAAAAASDASCSRRLVCMPFGNDDSSGFMHLEDGRRAAAAHLHMEQSRGGGGLVYPSNIGLGTIRNDRTSNSSVTESCLTMDLLPSCSHSKDDKRKGGWPKGKKRKDGILDSKAPKAPTTGYVLFLTERRRFYKDNHPEVSFAEVTKVLGHEWTRLPRNEKQKYLDEAEEDKKRYRRELNVYRQSESYRMKRSNGDGGHRSNDGNSIDFDDDVSDDLYCDVCDQFFSSLHNKKEHLYGRQHLQSITGESTRSTSHCRRQSTDDEINDDPYDNHYRSDLVSNIPQAIQDFMEMTAGRELEVKELRQHLTSGKTRNSLLLGEISKLQALERRLRCGIDDLQTQELRLKEQLGNLRMVPSLFGVINFQHQV